MCVCVHRLCCSDKTKQDCFHWTKRERERERESESETEKYVWIKNYIIDKWLK